MKLLMRLQFIIKQKLLGTVTSFWPGEDKVQVEAGNQ